MSTGTHDEPVGDGAAGGAGPTAPTHAARLLPVGMCAADVRRLTAKLERLLMAQQNARLTAEIACLRAQVREGRPMLFGWAVNDQVARLHRAGDAVERMQEELAARNIEANQPPALIIAAGDGGAEDVPAGAGDDDAGDGEAEDVPAGAGDDDADDGDAGDGDAGDAWRFTIPAAAVPVADEDERTAEDILGSATDALDVALDGAFAAGVDPTIVAVFDELKASRHVGDHSQPHHSHNRTSEDRKQRKGSFATHIGRLIAAARGRHHAMQSTTTREDVRQEIVKRMVLPDSDDGLEDGGGLQITPKELTLAEMPGAVASWALAMQPLDRAKRVKVCALRGHELMTLICTSGAYDKGHLGETWDPIIMRAVTRRGLLVRAVNVAQQYEAAHGSHDGVQTYTEQRLPAITHVVGRPTEVQTRRGVTAATPPNTVCADVAGVSQTVFRELSELKVSPIHQQGRKTVVLIACPTHTYPPQGRRVRHAIPMPIAGFVVWLECSGEFLAPLLAKCGKISAHSSVLPLPTDRMPHGAHLDAELSVLLRLMHKGCGEPNENYADTSAFLERAGPKRLATPGAYRVLAIIDILAPFPAEGDDDAPAYTRGGADRGCPHE